MCLERPLSFRTGRETGGRSARREGGQLGDNGERKGARVGTARRNEFSYKALSVSGEGPGGIRGEERGGVKGSGRRAAGRGERSGREGRAR